MTTTTTTTAPFRTLTARFPGTCRRCDGPIAIGQTIRYGGKGRCYHLAADCPGATDREPELAEPELAEPEPTEPTTTVYPRLPELAPRAAGETAEQYGLRALLHVTAERQTGGVDDEGLALAAHTFAIAVSNTALTTAGAERLADVGRMISRALAARQTAPLTAGEALPATITGEDKPNEGSMAALVPQPVAPPPPAAAALIPGAPGFPPVLPGGTRVFYSPRPTVRATAPAAEQPSAAEWGF